MLFTVEECDPDEAEMRLLMRGKNNTHNIYIFCEFFFFLKYLDLSSLFLCHPQQISNINPFLIAEFPSFAEYYGQLREADPAFAKQSMAAWKIYLKGPPNRPTKDEYGLLHVSFTMYPFDVRHLVYYSYSSPRCLPIFRLFSCLCEVVSLEL